MAVYADAKRDADPPFRWWELLIIVAWGVGLVAVLSWVNGGLPWNTPREPITLAPFPADRY